MNFKIGKLSSLFLLTFGLLISFSRVVAILAQPIESNQYKIRVGDVIDITVESYPEYSKQRIVRIDGMISYPIIGEIKAEGLTTTELEEVIFKDLSNRLSSFTKVYVSVVQFKRNSIYVFGMVKEPGQYSFETEDIYFLQALTLAGGVDYEKASLKGIQIRRAGKIDKIVDLTPLIGNAENIEDFKLQPDDVILVPSLLQQQPIFVTGAVLKQDQYPITEDRIHVLKALRMAGGPEQDIADLSNAMIIRANGDTIPINLEETPNPGSADESNFLYPGDLLHIPNAYEEDKVNIVGAVVHPGQYAIKRPVDMIEAISLAGGWLEDIANLKKAKIIRADETQENVNILEMVETGNVAASPVLNPGDTLQIPKRLRINWNALYTVTSIVSLIYVIFK
jgi:polysaccharide export outer membrane protein